MRKAVNLSGITIALSAGILAGCSAVGPDYEPPVAEVPDKWRQAIEDEMAVGQPDMLRWWESFGDPQLSDYIERSRTNNPGLKAAVARVREARAIRAVALGERLPDLDAQGGAGRSRTSDAFAPPTADQDSTYNTYSYGIGGSWELDVWGRVRRIVESANANFESSIESYRDVLVLLQAEVALTYTDIRTTQARIAALKSNIESQTSSLSLVKARNKAGIASDLELRQAELNLYRTRSLMPPLRARLTALINQLGVLLGEPPNVLHSEFAEVKPIPLSKSTVMAGVPGDLIRRRPDIRTAERRLASQTARIGIVTAELYPRFDIGGNFNILSTSSSDLGEWDNRNWNIGGIFSWNLFDGGRIRGRIEVEDARTEQALRAYEEAVLTALQEVENSMSDYVRELQRRIELEKSVVAGEESVRLALVLYRSGLTDFQNVLDMQRSLAQLQDQFAASQGQISGNMISIFTALGGGWDPDDLPALQ